MAPSTLLPDPPLSPEPVRLMATSTHLPELPTLSHGSVRLIAPRRHLPELPPLSREPVRLKTTSALLPEPGAPALRISAFFLNYQTAIGVCASGIVCDFPAVRKLCEFLLIDAYFPGHHSASSTNFQRKHLCHFPFQKDELISGYHLTYFDHSVSPWS